MLAVVLIFIACVLYWRWRRQRKVKATEPPELPGGWPIVGHLLRLVTDSCTLYDRIDVGHHEVTQMGGVVRAHTGTRTLYLLTDPDDSLTVATASMEKDNFYNFAEPWLGHGLITAKYEIWKHHRKLLNPAFSQILLDTFMDAFNSQSKKMVENLENEAGKGFFDHSIYTRHNALETICMTALGVDFTDTNLNSKYVQALEQVFKTLYERLFKVWLHSRKTFAWSNLKKKQDAYLSILHNMSNTVLQRRKAEFNRKINADTKGIPGTKFKPFIDLIFELSSEKELFTDKEIRDHVDTILVAGHDTTATVLTFTMTLLGSYPDVQEKAFNEIQEVLGGKKDVEKADLTKLVYLEAVLKETMRFYTIVPVIARRLKEDIKLKNYTLSGHKTCIIVLCGIHKHPIWGQDVNEFKPERWLAPDCPKAFSAFGLGKRNCIGKTYAMMSMKTTLAHVIRHFKIEADHTKMRVKIGVMIKSETGHHISIVTRT
ncbi:hypothetical protein PYW08_009497 [Mythimna loreyi]|uniref:Uncharacterized protein n=1 Tax=Mythimna loreyi TaxID=667449 RepID=A0ACC2Q6A9_9NEOP|nr:hypothetical protein PYW08_009497 [Mythimna loreyi]